MFDILFLLLFQLQTAYGVDISQPGYMQIAGVQETDAGLYKCVASNEAGTDTIDLYLDVGCELLIVKDNI